MLSVPRASMHCRQMHAIDTASLSQSKHAQKLLKSTTDIFYFSTAPVPTRKLSLHTYASPPRDCRGAFPVGRTQPALQPPPGPHSSAICTLCAVSLGRSGVSWPVHPVHFPRDFICHTQALNLGATCSLISERTDGSQVNEDTNSLF